MWLRLPALVFGVTVYAASTVLAGFMAGPAVKLPTAGRLARRFARPLAAFGAAEILVGLTALGSPLALDWLTTLWMTLHSSLPDSLGAITVPLMGATLPLIVKSTVVRERRAGARIGVLYAINTGGAIVGARGATSDGGQRH